MKPLADLTKLPKSLISKDMLDAVCKPIQALDDNSRGLMRQCAADVMKKVNELCSFDGKGDGKDDGKGDGKGDDKGDGKDDGKGDDKGAACASMKGPVCSRCVHVQVAGWIGMRTELVASVSFCRFCFGSWSHVRQGLVKFD